MQQQDDPIHDYLKKYKDGLVDEKKILGELEKHFYTQKYLIDRYITYDRQRQKLSGMAEIIYGEGKSAQQIVQIISSNNGWEKLLITRLSTEKWIEVQRLYGDQMQHSSAKSPQLPQQKNTIHLEKNDLCYDPIGKIASTISKSHHNKKDVVIVSGGASDLSVVREAEVSLQFFQRNATIISDVGVASLGRILTKMDEINQHKLIIAIAGMEASMPTVLNSLCRQPIIALPTSVGYGVSAQGLSALMSLLSSCSPGMAVVNINGGFSAAALAHKMLQM